MAPDEVEVVAPPPVELDLRAYVRDIPDFPKPGILFRDLTPLMGDGAAFRQCVEALAARAQALDVSAVVAIESRGFIFGAAVAAHLGLGFVPLRKPGKLPFRTRRGSYELEYGNDGIEIHEDAIDEGARVAVIDDLLATGGTAGTAVRLARELGAVVVGALFVIELTALDGRKHLDGVPADALIAY
jgi:adenine phosphoribosyltransferase